MSEFPWEVEIRKATRRGLESLSDVSVRPTTDEERREFVKLIQLGYIFMGCDRRIDSLPWVHFPKRLLADLIRLQARYDSLWTRFDSLDTVRVKLERKVAKLEKKQ